MATTPILGQLGGTQVPANVGLGGVNQGGNGATVTTVGGSTTPATLGGSIPMTATQSNPYAAPTAGSVIGSVPGTTANVQTAVDGGVPATSTVNSTTASGTNTFAMTNNDPSGVQSNGINVGASQGTDASNSLAGDFEATYGQGTGTAITDVLQNMGTNTDAAIQATISNTDLAAQQQMGNIQAQEAAGGVTPNSSTAALAESNFYSQVNSGLQSTISNDELNEESTLLNSLTTEGAAHGTDGSTIDSVLNGLSTAAGLGQSASSAVSAISPTTDTSWLDALGVL